MATNETNEWDNRVAEMRADAPFMSWLAAYQPHYENSEFEDSLLLMYDAWKAGRAEEWNQHIDHER
jgi:hypothetical protein